MATPLRPFPRPTSRPPVTPSPNLFARKGRPVSSPTQKEISMGWRLMGTWTVVSAMIMLTLLLLFGCAKEVPLPPVPAPPEDLSSWSVPELVQPPPPPELVPQAPKEKAPTSAEQILDFAPGTTFTLTVPVGAPLDIVLQRGEQVRNIIG